MARFASLSALKEHLKKIGYPDLKDKDTRSVFVLTDKSRQTVRADLLSQLGGKANSSTSFGGSLGHIDVDNFRVGVKPKSRQGVASAGVDNEVNLVQAINYVIGEYGPCDVIFTDGKVSFKAPGITRANRVGEDTAGRKKADLVLMGSRSYPISLKKDNAEYWESADSFWRANAEYYLNEAVKSKKVSVAPVGNGVIKITPNIGIEATDQEARDVVFGSDIAGNGCVITRTFDGNEFKYEGAINTLTITVSSVITTLANIPPSKKVWFLIRNDSTRKSIPNYPGTRALAAYESRISGSVIRLTKAQRTQ